MASTASGVKTQLNLTSAGAGFNAVEVLLPGALATKTTFKALSASMVDSGWISVQIKGVNYVLPMFLNA